MKNAVLDAPDYPFVRTPDDGGVASDVTVDLSEPGMPTMVDGALITDLADGSVEVNFDGQEGGMLDPALAEHDSNLAEFIDESALGTIGQEVCEAVEADLQSRREWLQRFRKGMELLGVIEPSANLGVLRHAKEISHPMIAKALVQYQARAITEFFPPEGPVKTIVLGEKSPEAEAQADRVGGYMNYQLTVEDRAYFDEADQGFFLLGLEGSIFKKVYRDALAQKNLSRLVMARDFIVPYTATSLATALRYTHILPYSQNDVVKLQHNGFYLDTPLDVPTGSVAQGQEPAVDAQDKLEGKENSDLIEDDRPHLVYEQHCDWDLKGFEHKDEVTGEATGIKLPYIIHVDRDTQKVLAIYRNWREDDPLKLKRIRFAHYKYLPGPGFYGLGLVHVIGGLGAAATGILRLLMVTAAFAGSGGGFKTKDMKMSGGVELEPGVFKDTEHTHDQLSHGFYQPDFKAPPEALFRVLGLVVEGGDGFASSTEAMTGEAPSTGPVGTMVALIEQGSKVFSGIHKRTHMAAGDEFRMLAELNGEYLPEGGYPYEVPGETREIFPHDFDKRVDVSPVSDPNIFSSVQRIALGQSILQLAKEFPGDVSSTVAVSRMLAALRVPDVEELLINKKVPRADAVSENALLMIGKPIRAYPDQDHQAHMAVVAAVMQDKQLPDPVKAAAAAHYAEHQALYWMAQASQAMQVPPLPLDLGARPGQPVAAQMDPQVENQLSQRAAQIINKLKPPPTDPAAAKVDGELALRGKRDAGELKLRQTAESAKLKIESQRVMLRAKLEQAQARMKTALEREVAFGKLALERDLAAARHEQEGRIGEAKAQREGLEATRKQVSQGVDKAQVELEDAIKQLAEGMDAVVTMVEKMMGGSDVQQPA